MAPAGPEFGPASFLERGLGLATGAHHHLAFKDSESLAVLALQAVGDGHARLALERSGERFGAIAFRTPLPLPPRIHALYRPELRHFRDLLDLTLVVDYWTPA